MGENEFKKFEQLVSEVSEMGGSTVLVFAFYSVETEPKKDSKSKTESKTGKKNRVEALKKLVDKCSGGVINCETPTTAELCTIIEKTCAKYKCSIHRDLCSYMVELCGNDSALLINEARKVAEYKGSGIISKADIDLMTCATPDAKVFDLSAKIAARDRTGAFLVLEPFVGILHNYTSVAILAVIVIWVIAIVLIDFYGTGSGGLFMPSISIGDIEKTEDFLKWLYQFAGHAGIVGALVSLRD